MKIDGKALQAEIFARIIPLLKGKTVSFVQFGNDPVSTKFVRIKSSVAEALGMVVRRIHIKEKISTEEAIAVVQKEAIDTDGLVVQLPLPPVLDREMILHAVPSRLDIDVLNPQTIEEFQHGVTAKLPPVAGAVATIFRRYSIETKEKRIVILGKGRLVGLPIAAFFIREGIPYESFDKTSDEIQVRTALKNADIIIAGIGVPGFVTPDMIQEGVILIDAGTSEQNGKLKGDIDSGCYEKASYYTPVPGGVGPLAIATLFENLTK